MTPWPELPSHRTWLAQECDRLLAFGGRFPHPAGGAAWLDDTGQPDLAAPVLTYICARMAHTYALAALLGRPGAGPLADHALAGLTGLLHDDEHGGWYHGVGADGAPVAGGKSCYDHVFVVLAGATGAVAGRPAAPALLAEALTTLQDRFWEPATQMYVDQWDTGWAQLDPYRGLNANMHAVEALLAAADATGDRRWREQALAIARRVVSLGREHGWRLPEHFDPDWTPMLEHNSDTPADPFQPYGATVGHSLEWSRLLLTLEAALGPAAPGELLPAARELFARAVADGWEVDGAPGFVYTVDWSGQPVVRDRMHWVLAEAVGAAAALYERTRDPSYADRYATWWDYAARHLLDSERGSWHSQLDAANRPASTVWAGKPDLYHAVQATLLPRLPLAPGLAPALAAGLLR